MPCVAFDRAQICTHVNERFSPFWPPTRKPRKLGKRKRVLEQVKGTGDVVPRSTGNKWSAVYIYNLNHDPFPFSVSVPGFSYIQPPASVLATTSTLLSQQREENLENSEWVLCKAKYT